jgi:hypothetical protein
MNAFTKKYRGRHAARIGLVALLGAALGAVVVVLRKYMPARNVAVESPEVEQ